MKRSATRRRKVRAVAGLLLALGAGAFAARRFLAPERPRPEPARRPASPPPSRGLEGARESPYDLLARVDPVLAPAVAGLFSGEPKTEKAAALELAAHFVASDTLTGLCPEAPDTLWVLAEAVQRKRAAQTALHLLYRDLALLADLEDYEKDDFVDALQDPLPVYVSLSVSHAPHVRESRRMFRHMIRLLHARGKTLTAWIRETDPQSRFAPNFLLRLNAYEALVPYLAEHPGEARAVPAMLFPERRADVVDLSADQIQNIFDSLASDSGPRPALHEFVEGCLTQIGLASGAVREKLTVFLHLNWPRLPPELREAAGFVIGYPGEAVQVADLRAPLPYASWPASEWRFSLHFADAKDLQQWERFFRAKGYRPESAAEDVVALARQIPGGPRIVISARRYDSLETGMMVGPVLKRFQATLAAELQDPAVQGVLVRAHAQFPRLPAFQKKKTAAKLWYDGSCRGAWDLARMSQRCPDCVLVGNVGSGRSTVNDPMVWALLEGLGRREPWDRLQQRLRAAVPEHHARLIGPWSTPFLQKLKTLKPPPKPKPRARAQRKPAAQERRP